MHDLLNVCNNPSKSALQCHSSVNEKKTQQMPVAPYLFLSCSSTMHCSLRIWEIASRLRQASTCWLKASRVQSALSAPQTGHTMYSVEPSSAYAKLSWSAQRLSLMALISLLPSVSDLLNPQSTASVLLANAPVQLFLESAELARVLLDAACMSLGPFPNTAEFVALSFIHKLLALCVSFALCLSLAAVLPALEILLTFFWLV